MWRTTSATFGDGDCGGVGPMTAALGHSRLQQRRRGQGLVATTDL
jgi:hypothetical protein